MLTMNSNITIKPLEIGSGVRQNLSTIFYKSLKEIIQGGRSKSLLLFEFSC